MSRLLCSFALRAMRYPAVVRPSACLTQAVRASTSSHGHEPTKTHGHDAEEHGHGHGHGHGGPAEAFVIHGGKVGMYHRFTTPNSRVCLFRQFANQIILFCIVDPTAEVASPLGGAIGPERFEQLKALSGIDDPYDLSTKPLVRALAPEQANLVPSSYDHRVAGCVCMPLPYSSIREISLCTFTLAGMHTHAIVAKHLL